jgi:hypothetical protein
MIALKDLKSALAPLSEIGHKEKEFDLFGMKITLSTLTPSQESSVQRAISDSQEDTDALALEFVDKFRVETLCRCIVQINDFDLRSRYVTTGEVLDNGVEVKITKEEAIYDVISSWSRTVVSQVFNSYALLVEEVEQELDSKWELKKFNAEDEKENLQSRIKHLENTEAVEDVSETPKKDIDLAQSAYTEALKGMGQ